MKENEVGGNKYIQDVVTKSEWKSPVYIWDDNIKRMGM